MRNRNPEIVEILPVGPWPRFKCKKCGVVWGPRIVSSKKPGGHGRFARGSWQCPRGCKTDEEDREAREWRKQNEQQ